MTFFLFFFILFLEKKLCIKNGVDDFCQTPHIFFDHLSPQGPLP
jgi:hypothetical protein